MGGPVEVGLVAAGPRHGLRNETKQAAAESKISFFNALLERGFERIESGSGVSLNRVFQMAGNGVALKGISRGPAVRDEVLTSKLRGLQAELGSRPDEVHACATASQGFSKSERRCSCCAEQSWLSPVIRQSGEVCHSARGQLCPSLALWWVA